MMQTTFRRLLKLKDLELFKVSDNVYGQGFGKIVALILIVDFKRKSTLSDFPYMIGIDTEAEYGINNYIKAFFIVRDTLETEGIEILEEVAGCFLEGKDNCDWNYDVIKLNSADFENVIRTENAIKYCNEFISKQTSEFDLTKIETSKFQFLSQD